MDARDNSKLTTYVDMILKNSTEHPTIVNHERELSYKVVDVDNKQDIGITKNSNDNSFAIAFPLYVSKKSKGIREVAEKSGLNWGLSKGHTSEAANKITRIMKWGISPSSEMPHFFVYFSTRTVMECLRSFCHPYVLKVINYRILSGSAERL